MQTLKFKEYQSLNEARGMRLETIHKRVPSLKDKLYYNDNGELLLYEDVNLKFTLPGTFSGFLNQYFKRNDETIPIKIDKLIGNFNFALYVNIYNFPKKITGFFQANNFKNEDLKTFPEEVGRHYWVRGNLFSLEGSPKYVGDSFSCGGNHLLTLAGFDGVVEGNFNTKSFDYMDDNTWTPAILDGSNVSENCLISKAYDGIIKGKLKTDKIITFPHPGVLYILKCLSDEVLEFHYRFLERHYDVEALNLIDKCLEINKRNLPFIKDPKVDRLRQIKNKAEDDIGFSF